jgi:hypothetical protein
MTSEFLGSSDFLDRGTISQIQIRPASTFARLSDCLLVYVYPKHTLLVEGMLPPSLTFKGPSRL